ncbi:zona pellucida glycoprotein d isoform X2 [Conger conger]|uniref:zona pellucida glycoprotein d isoform X2 n=1 Tax=Conger conger TaxID=82655 RepID=UPI002A59A19F|nr:zona pellucida glycoprotein d isoform X2 [Conger conger]
MEAVLHNEVCLVLLLGILCASEIAQGVCNVTQCTDPDRCRLSAGNRTCRCVAEYYGDLCEKVATFQVLCSKDYITIMVIEDFFDYHKVKLESLHLENKTCRARHETIGGVPYYIVRTSKEQYAYCGGKPLTKNITHVEYALTLMSDPVVEGYIMRDPTIRIEYKCIYPYFRRVSLPFPIIPASGEAMMRVHELDATVVMVLYKNETYTEAFALSPVVQLRDKVYVEIKVTDPEDFFHIGVNECWATQVQNPTQTDGSFHLLMRNGCVEDDTVQFLDISDPVKGVRYSFDMFRFVSPPHDLYLHCTVRLCPPEEGKLCVPECRTIAKREVVPGGSQEGVLTYGPIRLAAPEKKESNTLLTLVLPVGAIWIMGFFLLALIAFIKEVNKRMARLSSH